MKLQKLVILLAEDDENDVLLVRRAIGRAQIEYELRVVSDGYEAIEYLRADGIYSNRSQFPFPNIIITDLKMPRSSGMDLLQWLHDHEKCGVIPTIVLSSSAQPDDIARSYHLRASSYFTKPSNTDELGRLIKLIFEYWMMAHVPNPPSQERCQ